MRAVGNGVAARAFGAEAATAKPSRDAAPEAKHAYTRRKYEEYKYGAPNYNEAVAAAPSVAPVAPLTPQPRRPSATNTEGWALIDLFDTPRAAPAAAAAAAAAAEVAAATAAAAAAAAASAPTFAAPAHAFAAPAMAAGRNMTETSEVLRLFDPLPPLAQPPSKPASASEGDVMADAFFANFGL